MSDAITLLRNPGVTWNGQGHTFMLLAAMVPLALLILPLLAIVPMSFTATDVVSLPPQRWGFSAYRHLLVAPGWGSSVVSSLEVAAGAAFLAVVCGTAAAIGVGRLSGVRANLVTVLVLTPLAMPVVVMGLAQFQFFARLHLDGTLPGITLAHAVLGVPYVFLTMRAALARLDANLLRAAESLGAGTCSLLRWIYLPILLPAVLAGTLLAYGASLEEVVIAMFLSGPRAVTLPVKLFTELQYNLSPVILAVATLLLSVVLAFGLAIAGVLHWKGRNQAAAAG